MKVAKSILVGIMITTLTNTALGQISSAGPVVGNEHRKASNWDYNLKYTFTKNTNAQSKKRFIDYLAQRVSGLGFYSISPVGGTVTPLQQLDAIFSDTSLNRAVFIKFGVKPSKDFANKIVERGNGDLLSHNQVGENYFAVYGKNIDRKTFEFFLEQISVVTAAHQIKFEDRSIANYTEMKSASNAQSVAGDSSYQKNTENSAALQACYGCIVGTLKGTWDSTGGVVATLGKGLLHFVKFTFDPNEKDVTELWDHVSKAWDVVHSFATDFNNVAKKMYKGFERLDPKIKAELSCRVVAAIGAGALVTYFTAGAGAPALLAKIAQALSKIEGLSEFANILKNLKVTSTTTSLSEVAVDTVQPLQTTQAAESVAKLSHVAEPTVVANNIKPIALVTEVKPATEVKSVDELAAFLAKTGDIQGDNQKYSQSMAQLLYKDLGQDGVDKIVRDLKGLHSHNAKDAVLSAALMHLRGEDSGVAANLLPWFPKAMDAKTFQRWTKLGEAMTKNDNFLGQLELAVKDFKSFEYVHGSRIDEKKAFSDVIESLENLKNPSLVGHFVEQFSKADRLTRQYMLDEIVELKPTGNVISLALQGTREVDGRIELTKSLDKLLSNSVNKHQEAAYYSYRGNGIGARPELPDSDKMKKVALRFLKGKKYDLGDHDVKYATETLAKYPGSDPKIDHAMKKALNSGRKMPEWAHEYKDVRYALHELEILGRNARGVSPLATNLKYTASVLSDKTGYRLLLGNIIKFHQKYDLKKYPQLENLAVNYFKRFPESFDDLHFNVTGISQFKKDLGI